MSENHGLDTDKLVFFYEQEFYVLSNFSSFSIVWNGKLWPTSEHVYHSEKFIDENLKEEIRVARSAHDALKLATEKKSLCRQDWDYVKLGIMKEILYAKVAQHPYVKKKLLETGTRLLVENSWRDSYWGWGIDNKGKNHLGKLWMEVRSEIAPPNPF